MQQRHLHETQPANRHNEEGGPALSGHPPAAQRLQASATATRTMLNPQHTQPYFMGCFSCLRIQQHVAGRAVRMACCGRGAFFRQDGTKQPSGFLHCHWCLLHALCLPTIPSALWLGSPSDIAETHYTPYDGVACGRGLKQLNQVNVVAMQHQRIPTAASNGGAEELEQTQWKSYHRCSFKLGAPIGAGQAATSCFACYRASILSGIV